MVQTSGMILKALGCKCFWGTSSAVAVRMMPPLPPPSPAMALLMIAEVKVVEKPNIRLVIIVQKSPARIVRFLPKRSEARPQTIAVRNWQNEKLPAQIPAHLPISSLFTPKLSIISGRYGKTDVYATGSAKRQRAATVYTIQSTDVSVLRSWEDWLIPRVDNWPHGCPDCSFIPHYQNLAIEIRLDKGIYVD